MLLFELIFGTSQQAAHLALTGDLATPESITLCCVIDEMNPKPECNAKHCVNMY